tara:strand:- start:55 stop:774 length:720 start_codon:yes stop_codon:yes gene_type:complete
MTWEKADRSGGAAESYMAYVFGVNDFDVGQMIGRKAQSTDLLVSKNRDIWRIEVKSCSVGRAEAEFTIQNPITDDENLVYAFVYFNVKREKRKLNPEIFFVGSKELKSLTYTKSLKKDKKKWKFTVPFKGNFYTKKDGYTKYKENWKVFEKKQNGKFLPKNTEETKIIHSYHRLFVSNGLGIDAWNKEIRKRAKVDEIRLRFKKKYLRGDTFSSISKVLDRPESELKKWREKMLLPKRK